MKLGILCAVPDSPTLKRIIDTGRELGHDVTMISPLNCQVAYTGQCRKPTLLVNGEAVEPDLLLTRIGSAAPDYSLRVVRTFEQSGVRAINTSAALSQVVNKSDCHQNLARAGVPMPETAVFGSESPVDVLATVIAGPPWVVKVEHGRGGVGVMICESLASLRSVVAVLQQHHESLLLQEYIGESRGEDIRVLVLGGRAVAAIRRRAPAGEFRSNIKLGGLPEPVHLTHSLVRLAEAAAAATGLEIAGVDILESVRGPLVTEVNASPALSGISDAHQINFAQDLYEFLELELSTARA